MLIYFIILGGSFLLITVSALLALRWALLTGQLRHHEKAALLVFDDLEPLDCVTDQFPGRRFRNQRRGVEARGQ